MKSFLIKEGLKPNNISTYRRGIFDTHREGGHVKEEVGTELHYRKPGCLERETRMPGAATEGEVRTDFPLGPQRKCSPASTVSLDFWLLEQ